MRSKSPIFARPGYVQGQLSQPARLLALLALCALGVDARGVIRDAPFRQAVAFKFDPAAELRGATYQRLAITRDDVIQVLTDKGLARVFDERLALDRTYRALADQPALDLALGRGQLFCLYADQFLSTGWAGKHIARLPSGVYRHLAVADDLSVLLSGPTNLALFKAGKLTAMPFAVPRADERLYAWGNAFYVLAGEAIYRIVWPQVELFHRGADLTALAFRDQQALVGTRRGYYGLDLQSGRLNLPLQTNLPAVEITCLAPTANGVWAGTTAGVFFQQRAGVCRYFASRRWLADDQVLDLQLDRAGDLLALTRAGLSKIEFGALTLAQKADYYERKIRQRHIRYGFCAQLHLRTPGDIASAEMIDTDNDGTWSSYYLASQAFRYAATGDEAARSNAWETFETLERLQTINTLDGFPARTFERAGFKVSDPDRWHPSPDPNWEWKAHTSSDEITAHTFAYAVLYETAAKSPAEKARIAAVYDKIIAHIVRHNLYLVDVDGQPTLWGRWHPEYVNHYPHSIGDRRLNSAEIIAFLQFAYRLTHKELYRQKAFELLNQHGYLDNITSSMSLIAPTPGFMFRGNDMGNEWNHSDDLLAFVNYWTLVRFAFNDELRRAYAAAVKDHWEIEQIERNPLWNFVYAMTGAPYFDEAGALWTLQNFPLDLISWTVTNSRRRDLNKLPDNFRHQESEQLLSPDERPVMRWNGNPFILDGGDGGASELAGDEFLLPYWMGRYLKIIQ
jgi:hypothetical protein